LIGIPRNLRWVAPGALGFTVVLASAALAGATGRVVAPAVAPGIAALAAVATLAVDSWRWSGATPALIWLSRGATGLSVATLGPPMAAGLLAGTAGALGLAGPALAGYTVYLAAFLGLVAGAALRPADADTGVTTGLSLVALVYALPPVMLAVAELFPRPEAAIAAALPVWPPAAAAGLAGVDLMRLPWCYTNLPVAYYPYAYPSPWLAAGLVAGPALFLHATLWLRRTPPRGWRHPFWSTP
jgi:hypothetical protein